MSDDKEVKAKNFAYTVYPGDLKIMEWMQERLGASRSEIVRMALRYNAELIEVVEKSET